jgi:hypothetical protein
VCEVAPNIAVVREPKQRAFVALHPIANHTLGALYLHPRTISFGRLATGVQLLAQALLRVLAHGRACASQLQRHVRRCSRCSLGTAES